MNSDELRNKFKELNVWSSDGKRAPHKPLLVLWGIGRCLRGKKRLTSFEDTQRSLTELLRRFGSQQAAKNPHYPFWRLRNSGIWEVPESDRISITPSGDAHRKSLENENAHGGFIEEIYNQLQADQDLATEIAHNLVDAHFTEILQPDILQAVGIERFGVTYRKLRDSSFRKKVLSAYEHQCAICSLSIRFGNKPIGLDAAHIRWHRASGPDEVRNGLALCALHHRLFDYGAFTLTPDLTVEMSAFVTGQGYQDALGRFCSRQIVLLPNDDDLPDQGFLKWHRENVFDSYP